MRTANRTDSTNADGFRRLEVITGVGRRRRWSDEDKARIVAESLDPPTSASAVARRYGLQGVREVAAREGITSADVWAKVRSGELVAYRAPRGRGQWEWRLAQRAPPNATPCVPALLPLPPERTA